METQFFDAANIPGRMGSDEPGELSSYGSLQGANAIEEKELGQVEEGRNSQMGPCCDGCGRGGAGRSINSWVMSHGRIMLFV